MTDKVARRFAQI